MFLKKAVSQEVVLNRQGRERNTNDGIEEIVPKNALLIS